MRQSLFVLAGAAGLALVAADPARAQGPWGYPTVPTYPYGTYGPNFSAFPSYGYYPPRYAMGPYVAYSIPYYPAGVTLPSPAAQGYVSEARWLGGAGGRWHRRW